MPSRSDGKHFTQFERALEMEFSTGLIAASVRREPFVYYVYDYARALEWQPEIMAEKDGVRWRAAGICTRE